MLEGYKVIPFIPAGRKQTLEILFRYFEKNRDVIDEVHLWQNTTVPEDIDYLYQMARDPFYKVLTLPEEYTFFYKDIPKDVEVKWGDTTKTLKVHERGDSDYGPLQWNTGRFFEYCVDPEAIYIRFDDDIVYIDDNYFRNIVKFRIEHPEYWAVFGNIWNNAITSYLHQQEGNIGYDYGVCDSYCMDPVGWGNGDFAEYIHNLLLDKIDKGQTDDLYLRGGAGNDDVTWDGNGYLLTDGYRFSISNFAIFGKDYAQFGGKFPDLDEELWLTEQVPVVTGRSNVIVPDALVSHFTFSPYQKPHIFENTDLLKRYNVLSKKLLSKDYYKKLNTHE